MQADDPLSWAGPARSVELSHDDVEAMDIALCLVPELRLAALAVARATRLGTRYPIESAAGLASLLGDEGRLVAGGHAMDGDAIRRYLVPGDLPVDTPGELANVTFVALQRCRQHQHLQQALSSFDAGLSADPDQPVGAL